ncbi:U3 small nucleolar RNA-associated protein [Fusarium falciforme]|uniref:U3 small nucleolar RNA-associated protein n=1 Tax=Fusarium falciforme TaxID=195108 RepID=A0A9W8V5K5_9HYPO|nr:U3 small nucleolar RNA-associated protein [Fusarium falciforme]KAJ4195790.1 U3 small nucleolar RNA-associated protein [Fusarium falciforme]KAJ4260083.1 U3 small nucleolar RNA-associated protein [Fusarium falciforme]
MDVHRCRFVPYKPSAINAIAFSHPKTRSALQASNARLAIGRANGDIEIWNPSNGSWNQELIIPGGKDRSVDGLVWVNEPDQDLGDGRVVAGKSRLFSIGYTSTVTEWDLEKGKPKRHASGQHGDIWCMAAQPAGSDKTTLGVDSQDSTKLVAGTIDGELVMYSIEDDDLRFQRVLLRSPTKKAQMVSITFQSRKVAIIGCSDSTIRAYDITKGHMLRRMTLGSDLVGGSKDIIVWSVKCLPGGNIVSGDSTGQVCIWDGKTYTQTQRIQSHKQDVLSLATSADGTSILSGGMDRRTILYKQNAGAGQRWSKVWGRRYHDHDVKSMASFESGRISVVVSGGPDANPVVVPLKEMGRENHRIMSSLPQQAPLLSAPKARFVVSWWEREVHVWILRQSATDMFNAKGDNVDINQNRKLLKTIVVKGDSNITSASINAEGTLLVVSTANDVKAFTLSHQDPVKPSDVKMSSLELPQKLTTIGATKVQLSADSQWLCAIQEGSRVVMAKIDPNEPKNAFTFEPQVQRLARLRRQIPRYIQNGGLGAYDRTITHIAFSADSKVLATSDLAGYLDTWILPADGETNAKSEGDASSEDDGDSSEDEEDASSSVRQWIRNPSAKLLPKLPSAATVLSFSEDVPQAKGSANGAVAASDHVDDYTLLAITSSWSLLTFHPLQGSLTPWSRRHARKDLPAPVQDLLDLAKGVLWQGSRAWIYGVSFLLMLDLAQDLPKPTVESEASDPTATPGKQGLKRKRTGPTSGAGGKMEQGALVPSQVRKHTAGQWEDIDMDDAPRAEDVDSDDEMDQADGELAQLRNRHEESNNGLEVAETGGERKSWWMTYKYRPIFGVVPLSRADQPLEVALVERPTWDVEMPESYFSVEQWRR